MSHWILQTFLAKNGFSVEGQEELESLPDEILFQSKKRFFDKFMVWQDSSQRWICIKTLHHERNNGWKKSTKKVLKNYLIPFIQSKGLKFEEVLFWPDMSRVHYAECVQNYLKSIGLDCVKWGEKCTIRTTRKTN